MLIIKWLPGYRRWNCARIVAIWRSVWRYRYVIFRVSFKVTFCTPSSCFAPVFPTFWRHFCFSAPWQFTPLNFVLFFHFWFNALWQAALDYFNPLNAELNLFCYLLALLAHHFFHVSRIRVNSLTLRQLMSYIYMYIYIYIYIYGAPILDVSRPHTMTQHSR